MTKTLHFILIAGLALLVASAATADTIEIRVKDGSTWKGDTDQPVAVSYLEGRSTMEIIGHITRNEKLYVVVEGKVAGVSRTATIFKSDLVAIRTVDAAEAPAVATARPERGATSRPSGRGAMITAPTDDQPGVFFLPLTGMVGTWIRPDEIEAIGKEADKYGQGQIIILEVDTDGGLAVESEKIGEIIFDIRKRHRVIAWVQKAISAGCQLAMCCNEIYFKTGGMAGAVTTWTPGNGQSIKGEELQRSMEHLGKIAERSGYSPYLAYAMKTNSAIATYDKDPVTGEVTWYNDMSGEFVISDENSNVRLTSSTALHCGFSKGTADTHEELAALLDLSEWREVNDYGRRISKRWQDTVRKAEREIPRLFRDYQLKGTGSGDPAVILGTRISVLKELIQWCRRAPIIAQMNGLDTDQLERQIKELRRQLANQRR